MTSKAKVKTLKAKLPNQPPNHREKILQHLEILKIKMSAELPQLGTQHVARWC